MELNKQTWDKVRGWFHYPNIREPHMEEDIDGGAHFDFSSGEIRIGESYINLVRKTSKITEEECLEGILTHEIGHYMIFPRRLSNIILCGKMLDDFFKENQEYIFQTFGDMCNDVASVLDYNKREPVLRMRNASINALPDEVNNVI